VAGADERSFATFARGHVRDNIILAHFRAELRTLVNPTTGVSFTEDEIQRATGPGTRFYIEADAVDLLGQANQQRAIYFVSQIDPRKANTQFLEQFHGRLWLGDDSKLPATGAGGPVRATGVDGTIIPGSTTVPDPAAAVATDPNGLRYQALESATITGGEAVVTLLGIDTGFVTRLPVDTQLTWSSGTNPGTDSPVTVLAAFDGGTDEETDEEYAERIEERIRNRPASGNAAHMIAWAQESSNAVGKVFVYPCALQAGSTVIAILEKRQPILTEDQLPEGPDARVPSVGTLNTVNTYLTPPTSPVVPQRVFTLVTGVRAQRADMVVRISMDAGRSGGWADVVPWPPYNSLFPQMQVTGVGGGGLTLTVQGNQPLLNGAASLVGTDAPKLMLFNRETSRWVQLDVTSVTDPAPGGTGTRNFTIVLTTLPELFDSAGATRIPVVGDRLSPYTDRAQIISESIEGYFDTLGPSEVVTSTDPRYARAARQPRPSQEGPIRAGQAVLSYLISALGGSAADAELTSISRNEPDLPTNIVDGPNVVTFGHINIYPL
jgi:hypothetical protein